MLRLGKALLAPDEEGRQNGMTRGFRGKLLEQAAMGSGDQ